jgi:flavodoxin/ferredoxin
MQYVIYYFSGTGNNLAIAKQLGKELGGADIYPVAVLKDNKVISDNYQKVIFTVPSYYSHIPPFVKECMSNLVFTVEQKIFTICGCGGSRGRTKEDMRELIEKAGKKVSYEFMVMLTGNYILSYEVFPKWYQHMVTKISYYKIKKVSKIILSDSKHKLLGKGIFYSTKFEESMQESISNLSNPGRQYKVNESCIKCERCRKVCPVNNISIQAGKIMFGDRCQQCMACIQWCPAKAIDYNGIAQNRNRYHHPDITIEDMLNSCEDKQ